MFVNHRAQTRHVMQSSKPLLAPVPRFLHSTERQLDATSCTERVDVDLAGTNAARNSQCAIAVARPYRSHQAILGVVSECDSIGLVRERLHAKHGSENLSGREVISTRDWAIDARLDEERLGWNPTGDLATCQNGYAVVLGLIEEALDTPLLRCVDHGAQIEVHFGCPGAKI